MRVTEIANHAQGGFAVGVCRQLVHGHLQKRMGSDETDVGLRARKSNIQAVQLKHETRCRCRQRENDRVKLLPLQAFHGVNGHIRLHGIDATTRCQCHHEGCTLAAMGGYHTDRPAGVPPLNVCHHISDERRLRVTKAKMAASSLLRAVQ